MATTYEISNAEVSKFESVVNHVFQLTESQLRSKVQIKRWEQARQLFMSYLGTIEPKLISNLLGPTVKQDIDHKRRQITTAPYDMVLMLDMFEDLSVVTDFAGPYAEAQRMGAERFFDRLIIAAARGTAYETQNDGITLAAVTFPAGQKIAHGGTNLTIDKLLAANELFIENKVPMQLPRFMPLGSKQVTSLLQEVEYISRDYNGELAPLKSGQPAPFMGITFIPYDTDMTYVSSGIRYLPIWVAQAVGLGISLDYKTFADVLPTMNHARQFRSVLKVGAARLVEGGVVEVACKES
jgi:hypothetical protein